MPRNLLPAAAKGAAGFLLGLGLWAGFSGIYSDFVAVAAEPLVRLMERPAVTRLSAEGSTIIVNRDDFPRGSPRPQLPLNDLTFNIILLTTLFASEPSPLSTRNVMRFLMASVVLAITHVLAFVATVESVYALQLGPWSAAHYGPISRNFWSGAAHFYRIAGMYGIAFLLWWTLRASAQPPAAASGSRASGHKRRKRK